MIKDKEYMSRLSKKEVANLFKIIKTSNSKAKIGILETDSYWYYVIENIHMLVIDDIKEFPNLFIHAYDNTLSIGF